MWQTLPVAHDTASRGRVDGRTTSPTASSARMGAPRSAARPDLANDAEQGSVQGALSSLDGLAAIVSAIAATAPFAYFTGPTAPIELPGAPFPAGAMLLAEAIGLALRAAAIARRAAPAPAPPVEAPIGTGPDVTP
jgi:hypothetical protein